jgi:hypothetical protein
MTPRLVVTLPPTERAALALAFAHRAASAQTDLLEVRTDLHAEHDVDIEALARVLPLLVARRGRSMPASWRAHAHLLDHDVVDGDLDACTLVSHHATAPLTSSEALATWQRTAVPVGALIKHVEPLGAPQDFARLLHTRSLLSAHFGAGRVSVLAMGPLASGFRAVLSVDNVLEYTALDASFAAAPGQRLLADAVRARRAPTTTARLGILGAHIAGSRSPRIHTAPFDRIDLPVDVDLRDVVTALHPHHRGFAVTSPFKKAAATLSGSALAAVNTLVRTADGYAGANTDVEGARAVLLKLVPQDNAQRVTVLGDGGVTAALRMAADARGLVLHVVTRHDVTAPIAGPVVWTWPAHVDVPAALRFESARVAVVAYGAPALAIAAVVRARGGEPVLLGARWFIAQARAQRALWASAASGRNP